MFRGRIVNDLPEPSRTEVWQSLLDALLIAPHRIVIRGRAAMLRFTEATIILPVKNLDLPSIATERTEQVKIEVTHRAVSTLKARQQWRSGNVRSARSTRAGTSRRDVPTVLPFSGTLDAFAPRVAARRLALGTHLHFNFRHASDGA
jgi:hypothetical protein